MERERVKLHGDGDGVTLHILWGGGGHGKGKGGKKALETWERRGQPELIQTAIMR